MAAPTATPKSGYVNGGDVLISVGGKALGHCTSHTLTINTETKDRKVKAPASAAMAVSLYGSKGVVGVSISISAEGLLSYDESERNYKELSALCRAGKSVEVQIFEREKTATPYLVGKFVITSLERTDPAGDDATYSISLENDGAPTKFDDTALTTNAG